MMTEAEQRKTVAALVSKVAAAALAKIAAVQPPLEDAQRDAVEIIIADALSEWADGIVEIASRC